MEVAFDTSAIVKLILDEAGSAEAATLWASGARRTGSALALPEAVAALRAARRSGRLRPDDHPDAVQRLRSLWTEMAVVHVDRTLAEQAAILAEQRVLSGADAVHLAAALVVGTPKLIFATWDRDLAAAARAEGLSVAPAVI